MSTVRRRALLSLIFAGMFLWAGGALDVFASLPLVPVSALIIGSLLAVTAAYALLNDPRSGRRSHSLEEDAEFCLAFAAGLVAIGFAISPVTAWLSPAVFFLIGGLLLIAWSPQAFGRRRMPEE